MIANPCIPAFRSAMRGPVGIWPKPDAAGKPAHQRHGLGFEQAADASSRRGLPKECAPSGCEVHMHADVLIAGGVPCPWRRAHKPTSMVPLQPLPSLCCCHGFQLPPDRHCCCRLQVRPIWQGALAGAVRPQGHEGSAAQGHRGSSAGASLGPHPRNPGSPGQPPHSGAPPERAGTEGRPAHSGELRSLVCGVTALAALLLWEHREERCPAPWGLHA